MSFDSKLVCAVVGLDLRSPLVPSQWVNAVVGERGEGEGEGEDEGYG